MREKIVEFGPNKSLIGILTEPEPGKAKPHAPPLLASNVGLNHRVGPQRLWVDLARTLARSGYSMLRFDLSGLGDSAPRRDRHSELERAILDVTDAMDTLSKSRNEQKFVQIGFCSGVDSAHAVSVTDPRVVGAVFIEGYAFRTPRYLAHRFIDRTTTAGFWRLKLRKVLAYFGLWHEGIREAGVGEEIYTRAYPSREQLEREYTEMVRRGMRLLFIYSGDGGRGSGIAYNYADQFYDLYPSLRNEPNIEVEFIESANHMYSFLEDRTRLLQRIETWVTAHF